MTKGIFVTATGTDIGKTYICGLLLKKLKQSGNEATYYKGALSGATMEDGRLIADDARQVLLAAKIDSDPNYHVSYIYQTPVSPHLAAKEEGNPPRLSKMLEDFESIKKGYEYVVVEGSGGIICPLRMDDEEELMLTDLIKALNLKILIVATADLGTINSTILTINYAKMMNIEISGIILNRYDSENLTHVDNKKQIEKLSGILVCAEVSDGDLELKISEENLNRIFL